MAERRAGAPAGAHPAAVSPAAWQQVLNGTATVVMGAPGTRGHVAVQGPGQLAVLAAPRGAYNHMPGGQRHHFGSAGRAALHLARQALADQLQAPSTLEAQLLTMYQLGHETAAGNYGAAHQQQQHLHQHQIHQQYQQQQYQQQQQAHVPQQHGHRAFAVAVPPTVLPEQQLLLQHAGGMAADQLLANPALAAAAAAAAVAGDAVHVHAVSAGAMSAQRFQPTAHSVAAFAAAELQQLQLHQHQHHQPQPRLLRHGQQQHPHQHLQQLQHQQHQQLQAEQLQQLQLLQQMQQQLAAQQQQVQAQQQIVLQLQQQQEQQQQQQQLALAQAQAVVVVPSGGAHHSLHPHHPHHHHQQRQAARHTPSAVQPLSAALAIGSLLPAAAVSPATFAVAGAAAAGPHGSAHSSACSARLMLPGSSPLDPASGSSAGLLTASAGGSSPTTAALTPMSAAALTTVTAAAAGCGGDSSATEDICASSDADADSEYDGEDAVSPNLPFAETASSWASLTAGLLARVMGVLAAGGALPALAPALRRVCRHWRSVVDAHLEGLSPCVMKVRGLTTRFGSLRSLQLDHCANIRNRDLLVLSRSATAPHLHTLTLGDDRARPWVSNRGLASVCRIPSLTRLTLRDCMSITNRGLAPLSGLTRLRCLSLRGCRKLTNQGMEALRGLTLLQQLSLYGVVRLSDKGLLPLGDLPALRTLELGHTRVRDEGLGHAARLLAGLRSLALVREEVTDAGLRQLSALSGLTRLVLRDTVELGGETLAALLPALKGLQVLDLQRNWSFNNIQLARCLPLLVASPGLTSLDLRATWVCDEGIAALARIPSLRRLALSPQHEHWCKYLPVLPQLTQLTALALRNLPSLPYQLIEALAALPDLRELDVSEPPPAVADGGGGGGGGGSGGGGAAAAAATGWAAAAAATAAAVVAKEPLRPYTVAALARLRALRHLDLSRRHLLPDQALFLAMCMPCLERLVAVHCPLHAAAVASLWQMRPQLIVVSGNGAATLQALTLQRQQQLGADGGGPGAGAGEGEGWALLPPLDDADGLFGL